MALDLHRTGTGIYLERIPATFTKIHIATFLRIKHRLPNVPRIFFRVSSYESTCTPMLYHPYIEHNSKMAIYEWVQIQKVLETFVRTADELL